VSDVIRQALSRLSSAIDRLDATAIRQADGSRARANLELELHLMREDRRQLAAMLDGERGLRGEAEEAIASIAPRVEAAIEAVKAELQDMR
jgi:hypothetical protein